MTETPEEKPVVKPTSAKSAVKKEAQRNVMGISDYCRVARLTPRQTLAFTKTSNSQNSGKQFTLDEWNTKRTEFYSRRA